MDSYDVIVVGAGAMGSAAAYQAAKAGARVLLLEQYEIDHQMGSSYGHSRIIRYVYDHPAYIPLARAAYDDWRALEAEAGETLYIRSGGINFAPPGEPLFAAILDTLRATGIAHDLLSADEAGQRFPQYRFDPDMQVVYQADTGLMRASRCVLAHVRLAQAHGAVVRDQTPIQRVIPVADGVEVQTADAVYSAAHVILACGAWLRPLLLPLGIDLPLKPLKTQEIYFHPGEPDAFTPERFPAFIAHVGQEFGDIVYGIASVAGAGVKIALHGGPTFDDLAALDRTPDDRVIADMERFAARYLPGVWTRASARVCLYTMTPDEHFIIDAHPAHPQIVFASPCSGHGFKFSATIGRILSDLALRGSSPLDIDLFRIARFANQPTGQS